MVTLEINTLNKLIINNTDEAMTNDARQCRKSYRNKLSL